MPLRTVAPRVVLFAFVAALGTWATSCAGPERVEVRIDGLTIQAEVARTPGERARGLSGRDSMPEDEGMLFLLGEERVPSFWMRGMRFPLDFIWISADGRVAQVTEGVPPPEPDVPEEELPRYRPDLPVLYVLEVNAGVAREAGVTAGDAVTFETDRATPSAARSQGRLAGW